MKKAVRFFCYFYLVTWLLAIVLWKVFFSFQGAAPSTSEILLSPSLNHIFGTDALGRDLFLRTLEGGYISAVVGLASSVLSILLACLMGVGWSWFRSKNKFVITFMDLMQALPSYVVSSLIFILIQGCMPSAEGTMLALILALAATHWMNPARVLRAQTLQLKVSPFVEAAYALGGSSGHVLKHHIIVHLRNTILVLWALQVPILLMYESFMSFIGFGVEAPYTSWGILLQEGWRYLSDYPHLLLAPGAVLFSVLLALNYILDSYRYQGFPEGRIDPPKADSKAAATEMVR